MKSNHFITVVLIAVLAACQSATPLPTLTITDSEEFTLAVDQYAVTSNLDITIRFLGVAGDERCPSELECAVSGPVSVLLSIQQGDAVATEMTLQSFTDSNGRAPEGPFEGIQDHVTVGDYLIRLKGVLPYPLKSFNEIKDAKYQVTLVVSRQ